MKRIVATTLALALAAASGSAFANQDDYGYGRDDGEALAYGDAYDGPIDDQYGSEYDNSQYDNAYGNGYERGHENGARYDVAQVVGVDPIVQAGHQGQSRQCWSGPQYAYPRDRGYRDGYYREGRHHRHSGPSGGTVLGAVIGGALGNLAGKGDGRHAATIVGAVIGGAIGNSVDHDRRDHGDRGYGRVEGHYGSGHAGIGNASQCRTISDYDQDGRVIGYDVSYEYNGQVYHTTTSHHPGSSIRVRVDVIAEEGQVAGY